MTRLLSGALSGAPSQSFEAYRAAVDKEMRFFYESRLDAADDPLIKNAFDAGYTPADVAHRLGDAYYRTRVEKEFSLPARVSVA